MKNLMRKLFVRWELLKDRKGVTMIEYTLIAALISIAALVVIGTAGDAVNTIFTSISDALTGAATPAP